MEDKEIMDEKLNIMQFLKKGVSFAFNTFDDKGMKLLEKVGSLVPDALIGIYSDDNELYGDEIFIPFSVDKETLIKVLSILTEANEISKEGDFIRMWWD